MANKPDRKNKKKGRKNESIFHKNKKLVRFFAEAGVDNERINPINRMMVVISAVLTIIIAAYTIFSTWGYHWRFIFSLVFLEMTFGFFIVLFVVYSGLFFYLDIIKHRRKTEIERVLPEYLLLTSSNMRAGMLIDQALWYSIRPKFGVLAKEMETVSKEVMGGKDLSKALVEFSARYDSVMLKRSIGLIVEGIESGGKIAEILNKIAINLSDIALQKKEMSASVTTYAIFISFASIGAAPVLMALAGELLEVIRGLMGTLADSGADQTSMSFMKFSPPTLTANDFVVFSVVMLCITSFFSSVIIANIRKGDLKSGLKYVPVFILVSLLIFLLSRMIMGSVFSQIFVF